MPDPNQKPEPPDLGDDSPLRKLFEDLPRETPDDFLRRIRKFEPKREREKEPVDE